MITLLKATMIVSYRLFFCIHVLAEVHSQQKEQLPMSRKTQQKYKSLFFLFFLYVYVLYMHVQEHCFLYFVFLCIGISHLLDFSPPLPHVSML